MYSINLFFIILIILVSKSIGDEIETSYDSTKCQLARAIQKQEVNKTELRSRKKIFQINKQKKKLKEIKKK